MHSGVRLALVMLVLALSALPAPAIELEPIQVRSRIGDPLLAEIRLRDVPADAGPLSARLPDPVVFARVGLPRPRGVISELQFEVLQSERGSSTIRISTAQPVDEDFLTFLVQVEWSQGSLVREFSIALPMGAPPVLPTGAAPDVAPAVPSVPMGPTNTPDPAPADSGQIAPIVARPASIETQTEIPEATRPIPVIARGPRPATESPLAEAPAIPIIPRGGAPTMSSSAQAPAASTMPLAPSISAVPAQISATAPMIAVRRGHHLTGIIRSSAPDGMPLESALVAFLVANPEAFIDGNINRLKQGATLRVPSPEMIMAIDPARARALVSLHASDWRSIGDDAQHEAMASLLSGIEADLAPAPTAHATAIAVAPARMEIVPVADAQFPDSANTYARVHQDTALQDEVSASRDIEIRYLQQKIAGLERENEGQRALIAMQNEALAQAQRQIAPVTGASGILRSPWAWLTSLLTLCLGVLTWRRRRRLPHALRARS